MNSWLLALRRLGEGGSAIGYWLCDIAAAAMLTLWLLALACTGLTDLRRELHELGLD